jgi:hypothetical protein
MHEREKEGARKYERKKQGAGEREGKKREIKVQKECESASARGFRTGGRMRKREDPKSTYPALHTQVF